MSRLIADQESLGVDGAPGVGETDSVMRVNLAERCGPVNAAPRGWFIWFIWFIWFVWLNETNQMNQINQINKTNQMNQVRCARWMLFCIRMVTTQVFRLKAEGCDLGFK